MDKLKFLEVTKLIKELDYIESDFEYRTEIISEADDNFIKCVNDFLNLHPELKEVYDNKVNDKINESIKCKIEPDYIKDIDQDIVEDVIKDVKVNISPKLKKLYREIVKLTHPDKVNNKKFNDLYLKATEYYDNNDKIGIYKICSELNIEYYFEEEDQYFINEKIESLKKRIIFLESTFTWKWYNTEDECEKNQILMDYIKIRLK